MLYLFIDGDCRYDSTVIYIVSKMILIVWRVGVIKGLYRK